MTGIRKQKSIARLAAAVVAMASLLSLDAFAGPKAAPAKDIVDTAVAAGSFKTLCVRAPGRGSDRHAERPRAIYGLRPDRRSVCEIACRNRRRSIETGKQGQARGGAHLSRRSRKCYGGSSCQNELCQNGKRPTAHHSHEWRRVMIDNAKVVKADILCTNGVIHVLDSHSPQVMGA